MPNPKNIQRTKRINKIKKDAEYRKALQDDNTVSREERIRDLDRKYAPQLNNAVRSMRRSKDKLTDILKCNDFNFFVTLTFDDKKLNNTKDEREVRQAFRKWRDNIKHQFPHMTYVAIEEYQDRYLRGVLHYHLAIGNVTKEQLRLIDSGHKVRKGRTKGQTIYNVTAWKYGFSTATEILDSEAVKFYLSKYLTKNKADPRFFGKKRYFTSQNINRPTVEKFIFPCNENANIFDSILKEDYFLEYEDLSKEYTVLTRKLT